MTSPAQRLASSRPPREEKKGISTKLMKVRLDLKLTGVEVARETGIHQSALNRLERGVTECSLKNALKLAKFFGYEKDVAGLFPAYT